MYDMVILNSLSNRNTFTIGKLEPFPQTYMLIDFYPKPIFLSEDHLTKSSFYMQSGTKVA